MSAAWYRTLTITSNASLLPSTLTDFTVPVVLSDVTLKTVANGGKVQHALGYDIKLWSTRNVTPLNYERESYDGAAGTFTGHVKIPVCALGGVIFVTYGDPAISTDQSNPTAAWDANTLAVWHLGTPSVLSATDSTATGLNGTLQNTPTAATGVIGGAGSFARASSQYISGTGATALSGSALTISLSIKPNTYVADMAPFSVGDVQSGDKALHLRNTSDTTFRFGLFSDDLDVTVSSMAGVWNRMAATLTSGLAQTLYRNGASVGTRTASALFTGNGNWNIGRQIFNASSPFDGLIDEVRVSTVARSADWLTAESASISAPGTFLALGAETSNASIATFQTSSFWRGEDQLDAWVETYFKDASGALVTLRDADRDLSDPSSYFGGPKNGRIMSWGRFELPLSDRTGQLQGATVQIGAADNDRRLRSALTNPLQRGLPTSQVVIRAVLESQRLAAAIPAVIFRGLVSSVTGPSSLVAAIGAQDKFSSRMTRNVPLRRIGDDFTNAPQASQNRLGPLWYGKATDSTGVAPAAAPTVVADSATGATTTDAGWIAQPGTPATALVITDTSPAPSGSGVNQFGRGRFDSDEVFVLVAALHGATPSEPVIGSHTMVQDNRALIANWTLASGGDSGYLVACGMRDVSGGPVVWKQVITVGAGVSTCEFDATPASGEVATGSNISWFQTPAAVVATNVGGYEEVATAIVSGLEGNPSAVVTVSYRPFPSSPSWAIVPVGSATGYRFYRKVYGGALFTQRFAVPTSSTNGSGNIVFNDNGSITPEAVSSAGGDGQQGTAPGIDVGDFVDSGAVTWGGFVVCHRAAAKVEDPVILRNDDGTATVLTVANAGGNLDVPGATGFNTRWSTPYRDMATGARYTLVYLKGDYLARVRAGSSSLFVNLWGVEPNGDGTGTVIENPELQLADFFDNYAGTDTPYVGGSPHATPLWADGTSLRDTASFTQYATSAAATIVGSRAVAWGVLAAETIADRLAVLMVLMDAAFAFTKAGQFRVVLEPPDRGAPAPVAALTDIGEIVDASPESSLDLTPSFFWNIGPLQTAPVWDSTGGVSYRVTTTSADNISRSFYGDIPNTAGIAFEAISSALYTSQVLNRRLLRAANPAVIVSVETGLNGLAIDVGDYVTVQSAEAPWDATASRLVLVRAWAPDLSSQRVLLTVHDAEGLMLTYPSWIALPFSGDWSDVGSGNATGRYRHDPTGTMVILTGAVKSTGSHSGVSFPVCTLPSGYRPTNVVNCIGSTVVGGVDKGVVVSINTAGQIIVEASQSPTTSAFVSLDGISFAIDQ